MNSGGKIEHSMFFNPNVDWNATSTDNSDTLIIDHKRHNRVDLFLPWQNDFFLTLTFVVVVVVVVGTFT